MRVDRERIAILLPSFVSRKRSKLERESVDHGPSRVREQDDGIGRRAGVTAALARVIIL